MAERCSAPSDGDGDDTNAQRAKRRRAAPNPSTQAIDAADLRLLESLFAHDVDGVPSDDDTPRMELRDFRFLARGHKGVVYVANYSCAGRTGRVAIKVCRDGGARQEERWLQRCNELGIGASLVRLPAEDECVVMEYVEGPSIGEALDGAVPPGVLFKALRDLLGQCARLDERGIDKREMNRCQKHVIVSREGRSTLLDFERCRESPKPANVTGLAQYLTQAGAVGKLRGAGASVDIDAVRAACKAHKKAPSPETVAAVEEALGIKAAEWHALDRQTRSRPCARAEAAEPLADHTHRPRAITHHAAILGYVTGTCWYKRHGACHRRRWSFASPLCRN